MNLLSTNPLSFDSSVVIDYERVGRLTLLTALFSGRILISDFVDGELTDSHIKLPDAQVIALATDDELELFDTLRRRYKNLGVGEIGALAVAKLRGGVLLANDGGARLAAQETGVQISGSLGVLAYAIDRQAITRDEALSLMDEMFQSGAWFSEKLMADFREQISTDRRPPTKQMSQLQMTLKVDTIRIDKK